MNRYRTFSVVAPAISGAGTVAYAANNWMENDASAISRAKISLTQAVPMAKQHAGGKAAHAESENSKNDWIYNVKVVSGAKIFGVKADADQGIIFSSSEGRADRDDDRVEKNGFTQ